MMARELRDLVGASDRLVATPEWASTATAFAQALAHQPPAVEVAPLATISSSDASASWPADAPRVIGLCGYPRSGKDALAELLLATYRGVERIAFSDAIVAEVNQLRAAYGAAPINEATKSDPPFRLLLQEWGMLRRVEDPDYWVRKVEQAVMTARQAGVDVVLLTGVRQPSDADLVHRLGGALWLVDRPGNTYRADHRAELAVADRANRTIVNVDHPDWQAQLLTQAQAAIRPIGAAHTLSL